ncbi:MAG: nickel pincer cofactor biosynthesis protein LarC [Firmicutes bacterium]|nr:nickel pincer cofactor biosynthesis protein LarC [Bacillota bacterium]
MRIAYIDCSAGASGDMLLAALLDAGLPLDPVRRELRGLIPDLELECKSVLKAGIHALSLSVRSRAEQPARTLKRVEEILLSSGLPDRVKHESYHIFADLAEVEARIHGLTPDQVHFHELGGVDTIVDIVGTVLGFREMAIDEVWASPLDLGEGQVETEHGTLPIPAPATLELCRGAAVCSHSHGEATTPTGAALVTRLAAGFGGLPRMRVDKIGYGAGSRDTPHPNVLRLIIGESPAQAAVPGTGRETDICVLEANIDDMNPEFYDHIAAGLLQRGAFDVFLTPVQMKKLRPGTLVTVLVPPALVDEAVAILIRESTTLGVRIRPETRVVAHRQWLTVDILGHEVRVKHSSYDGQLTNIAPEHEDCRRAALATGRPLKWVYAEASCVALRQLEQSVPCGALWPGPKGPPMAGN